MPTKPFLVDRTWGVDRVVFLDALPEGYEEGTAPGMFSQVLSWVQSKPNKERDERQEKKVNSNRLTGTVKSYSAERGSGVIEVSEMCSYDFSFRKVVFFKGQFPMLDTGASEAVGAGDIVEYDACSQETQSGMRVAKAITLMQRVGSVACGLPTRQEVQDALEAFHEVVREYLDLNHTRPWCVLAPNVLLNIPLMYMRNHSADGCERRS